MFVRFVFFSFFLVHFFGLLYYFFYALFTLLLYQLGILSNRKNDANKTTICEKTIIIKNNGNTKVCLDESTTIKNTYSCPIAFYTNRHQISE